MSHQLKKEVQKIEKKKRKLLANKIVLVQKYLSRSNQFQRSLYGWQFGEVIQKYIELFCLKTFLTLTNSVDALSSISYGSSLFAKNTRLGDTEFKWLTPYAILAYKKYMTILF